MLTIYNLAECKRKTPKGEESIHDTSTHPKETGHKYMMKVVLDDIDEKKEGQNEE